MRSRAFSLQSSCLIRKRRTALSRPFSSKLHQCDVDVFQQILADEPDGAALITDSDDLENYNTCWLRQFKGHSKLALRPSTTEQVSAILKHCNERRIPVVPQGGNTGLVGGSVPISDEVVLSLSRMNKVIDFNEVSGILVCEAGCILQTLDEWLGDQPTPHCMPLDLGAKGNCQIGGNISTNAGGLRYVRYGSLHGSVLGLEVVLADGRVLDSLSTLRKNNTGYHLKHMFIGAEGSLGIVTKASILVPPLSSAVNVAFLACPTFEAAQRTYTLAKTQLGEILSAVEFMDHLSLDAVGRAYPDVPLPECVSDDCPFYVLLETRGSNHDHDQEKLMAFLESAMGDPDIVVDGVIAQDEKQAALLWRIREDISIAMAQLGQCYKYDVSLPIGALYEPVTSMRAKFEQSAKHSGSEVMCVGFGHLGDGNLHLNVTLPGKFGVDPEVMEVIEPHVYELISEHGGSVSAEHGLGQQKRDKIFYSRSEEEVRMMQDFKAMLDPNNILNPNKVLPKR